MTKPFDVKDLAEKLKAKGFDVAEDAAKLVFDCTIDWVNESVVLTENKIDDMIVIAIPKIKEIAHGYIDKIDGEQN